jgi:hypothetical protein
MANDLQKRLEVGSFPQKEDLDGAGRRLHLAQLVLCTSYEVI